MIKIVKGNLLNAEEKYVIHQVNCQGVMGSGVAKSIKNKWYEAFEDYKTLCDRNKRLKLCTSELLGYAQFVQVEDKTIINLFGQDRYGLDKRHTNYIALVEGMIDIFERVDGNIAMPYKMGCDRGGADWNKFYNVLECLAEDFKYDIVIYQL
jgi:O-acetyl-ADP-ribose deacetylase (regulator of RNase III)